MNPDIVVLKVQLHHLSSHLFLDHPFILSDLCLEGVILEESFATIFGKRTAKSRIIKE